MSISEDISYILDWESEDDSIVSGYFESDVDESNDSNEEYFERENILCEWKRDVNFTYYVENDIKIFRFHPRCMKIPRVIFYGDWNIFGLVELFDNIEFVRVQAQAITGEHQACKDKCDSGMCRDCVSLPKLNRELARNTLTPYQNYKLFLHCLELLQDIRLRALIPSTKSNYERMTVQAKEKFRSEISKHKTSIRVRNFFAHILLNPLQDFERGKKRDRDRREQRDLKREYFIESQGLFTIDHNIQCTPLQEIVDMVHGYIDQQPGVAPGTTRKWYKTLFRFLGMLQAMIKQHLSNEQRIYWVINFLMEFDVPNIYTLASEYGQVLAQVFQVLQQRVHFHGIVAQGDVKIDQMESLLTGTAKLFAAIAGITEFNAPNNEKRAKKLVLFANTIQSVDKLITFAHRLYEYAMATIAEHWLGFDPYSDEIKQLDVGVYEWMLEIHRIKALGDFEKHIIHNKALALELYDLRRKGDKFAATFVKLKVSIKAYQYFTAARNDLHKMCDIASRHHNAGAMRIPPLVVELFGRPGVGKTIVQNLLTVDVMASMRARNSMIPPFHPYEGVYVRNSTFKHWDGYTNQPVLLMDDFLQDLDPQISAEQIIDVIRMGNAAAFPLPMASLEQKGATYFTSDLVMITSNVSPMSPDLRTAVRDRIALVRRIDVCVHQLVKAEFRTALGTIDGAKVRDHFGNTEGFQRSIYEFDIYRNGEMVRNSVDYDTLLAYTIAIDEERVELQTKLLRELMARSEVPISPAITLEEESEIATLRYYNEIAPNADKPCDHWSARLKQLWYDKRVIVPEYISKYKIEFSEWFHVKWNNLINSTWWSWLKYGLLALGALSGVAAIYKLFVGSEEAILSENSPRRKDVDRAHRDTRDKARMARQSVNDIVAHGCSDQNAVDVFGHCISKNLFNLVVYTNINERGNYDCIAGNALFVRGRVFVTSAHLFKINIGEFCLRNKWGVELKCQIDECKFSFYEKYDIVLVCLPKRFSQQIDIVKHFHSLSSLQKNNMLSDAILYTSGDGKVQTASRLSDIQMCDKKIRSQVTVNDQTESILIEHTMKYTGLTQRGDCGGPVVWLNSAVQSGKILGIHIAGDTACHGWCAVISSDWLNEELKQFDNDNNVQLVVSEPIGVAMNLQTIEAQSKRAIDYRCQLQYFGQVPLNNVVRSPSKTKLRPSLIYGVFPVLTQPALLVCDGEINPLRNGVLKQIAPLIVFPSELVYEAAQHTGFRLNNMKSPYKRLGLLSDFQAINGIAGSKYVLPMDMHTSPGVPYIHERCKIEQLRAGNPTNGKFAFVCGEPGNYSLTDYANGLYQRRLVDLKNGIVTPTLFVDTLKDEKRLLEKVKTGNTRVFNVAPMDLNLALRKYFGSFKAHIMYNNVEGDISIGINPDGPAWTALAQRFERVGEGRNMLGGDYSNYDKTLSYQISLAALEHVVQPFYEYTHIRERSTLLETVISAFHQVGCDVYRVHQGNPSGIAITTELNSLVNVIMLKMCFIDLGRAHGIDISQWDDNVELAVYGDDWLASVSDDVVTWFNMLTIIKWFSQYNIKMTIPDKNATEFMPCLTYDETIFLKRRFRWHKGVCYAPLAMESIWGMMNWIRESFNPLNALQDNYDGALRMMTHYGEDEYALFVKHVQDHCRHEGVALKHRTFAFSFDFWGKEEYVEELVESQGIVFTRLRQIVAPIVIEGTLTNDEYESSSYVESDEEVTWSDIDLWDQESLYGIANVDAEGAYREESRQSNLWWCIILILTISYSSVNRIIPQTPYRMVNYCYLEEESIFMLQQVASASINNGFGVMYRSLVDFPVRYTSTTTSIQNVTTPMNLEGGSNTLEQMNETRTSITTFADAAPRREDTPQNTTPHLPVDPYEQETMVSFLSRVYSMDGVWDGTSSIGALLAEINFPNFLCSVPQLWNKMQNYEYLRAGVRIGIRINGTKFHFGQIAVTWSPMGSNTGSLDNGTNNVYSALCNPSFTMSPSENETHVFDLPYAHPLNQINISRQTVDPFQQFGVLRIYVMNPLILPGSMAPAVNYTIFANFIDLQIGGYTGQSNGNTPARYLGNQSTHPAVLFAAPNNGQYTKVYYTPRTTPPPEEDDFVTVMAQGKNTVMKRVPKEQVEKSEKGMIGSIAETVGKIAGSLVVVPEIGEVAMGVQAVAGVVGTIANYFGLSKPNSLESIKPIIAKYSNLANTHGLNEAQVLSMDPANAVKATTELMGSHDEEMTVPWITGTPSPIKIGQLWASSYAAGTILDIVPVSPSVGHTEVLSAVSYTCPTYLSWVSSCMGQWRGSLRYHFQVVCSQMHSGRLRISYIPNDPSGLVANADTLQSMASKIIDVAKETSVSFTIPYISSAPYLPYNYAHGAIIFTVVNELEYPSDTIPSVYMNLFVSAGDDFQLGSPAHMADFMLNTRTLLWYQPFTDPEPVVEAQGLTREELRTQPAPPLIPAVGARDTGTMIGESFTHIKELLARPMLVNSTAFNLGDLSVVVDPFGGIPRSATINEVRSYWDHFRCIFRYARGSMTFRVISQQLNTAPSQFNGDNAFVISWGLKRLYSSLVTLATSQMLGGFAPSPSDFLDLADSGIHLTPNNSFPQGATVPFYCSNYFMHNYGTQGVAGLPNPLVMQNAQWPVCNIAGRGSKSILMAAGDDVQMGFLVGPPMITTVNPP